jgi:hypothetical protein
MLGDENSLLAAKNPVTPSPLPRGAMERNEGNGEAIS